MELNDDAGGPGDAATSMGLLLWGQRLLTGFRRDSESISPMTARGTINVVVWIVATVAIGLLGRLLVPALGAWWGAIALAVMVWVAIRFDRRREPPA